MKIFSKVDKGIRRRTNQDYVYATARPIGNLPNLLIVADGMGGHNAGDFASRFVVETVQKELAASQELDAEVMIRKAIQSANFKLLETARRDASMEGMGTTLVVATVMEDTLYFANIGDSRIYLLNTEIKQLSRDHSYVQEMVRLGGMNVEDAKHHPDKNIITRAVGTKDKVEIDFFEYRLQKGDRLLMCTDGLSNMLEDDEMLHIVHSSRDMVEAVERLVAEANEHGGQDNIGVILAEPFAGEVKR